MSTCEATTPIFPSMPPFCSREGSHPATRSDLQQLGLLLCGRVAALLSLPTNLRHTDGLLQHLLGVRLLLLRQSASLLIAQLAQPFIRQVHPTQSLEHACCRFIGPGTADQRGQLS